jgi:excisionase family DNA binding protein
MVMGMAVTPADQGTPLITIPDPRTEPTISVWPQAARLMGVSRGTAYAAAHAGDIPVVRVGIRLRVPTQKLLELLGLA